MTDEFSIEISEDDLDQVLADIEEEINKAVRQTALAALTTVVQATPVDTGRARGNWLVSIDEPRTEEVDREDKSGAETISEGSSEIASYKGGEIHITNNVPYIGKLNDGNSKQAPAGFVEMAVEDAKLAVSRLKVDD